MAGDSYTLREVAELLGVSKRTLQRRIKEGAFPGRFLAPGRHGLETRIPAHEVQRAVDDLRSRSSYGRIPDLGPPIAATEIARDDSLVPYATPVESRALSRVDIDTLRDTVVALVREDRETMISAIQDSLIARDRELAAIRSQLSGLHGAIERLRRRLESGDLRTPQQLSAGSSKENGDSRTFDVDAVLQEIDEIEQLLSTLQG